MSNPQDERRPQIAERGETLGAPHGDWPSWCTSFRERLAYQHGVADARANRKPRPSWDRLDPDPLADFEEGQWWIAELDALATQPSATDDQKRAVAVVHHMLASAKAALANQRAEVGAPNIPKELDVRTIMLDVVPGENGMGEEVFAKTVADVETRLTAMGQELEEWQLGIRRHPAAQPEAVPQGGQLTDADRAYEDEHPSASRMRLEFEAKYGNKAELMRAANHWFNVRTDYNAAWNRERERPVTEDDVDSAERAMLAAAPPSPQPPAAQAMVPLTYRGIEEHLNKVHPQWWATERAAFHDGVSFSEHFHGIGTAKPAPERVAIMPLSEQQIEDCIDEANRLFNGRRQGPSGQQLTSYDDWKYWLVRSVERFHGITAPAGGGEGAA